MADQAGDRECGADRLPGLFSPCCDGCDVLGCWLTRGDDSTSAETGGPGGMAVRPLLPSSERSGDVFLLGAGGALTATPDPSKTDATNQGDGLMRKKIELGKRYKDSVGARDSGPGAAMNLGDTIREADDALDAASIELEAAHQAVLDAETRRSVAHKAWQDALGRVRQIERDYRTTVPT